MSMKEYFQSLHNEIYNNKFLKECALEIVDAYVLLFQASIDQGKVPQGWKSANIIPLFKKGRKL